MHTNVCSQGFQSSHSPCNSFLDEVCAKNLLMKTQPYGKLTQHACLTTPLRNLTLFRFLLTPKFHMTRPLLSSSWEVSCGAQLESHAALHLHRPKPGPTGSPRSGPPWLPPASGGRRACRRSSSASPRRSGAPRAAADPTWGGGSSSAVWMVSWDRALGLEGVGKSE